MAIYLPIGKGVKCNCACELYSMRAQANMGDNKGLGFASTGWKRIQEEVTLHLLFALSSAH
jgi:hypothetical protein